MKIKILILLLITVTIVHSETNLFRFSGTCVVIKTNDIPKKLTADEVLNFPDAIKYPFPEIFFLDDGGTYGVTNWSRFPDSKTMVGSEFSLQVDVSRRVIDNKVYFSKADYRFRFFDEWNEHLERFRFIREGSGFSTISIGKNVLSGGEEISDGKKFTIVRIDKISTSCYEKNPPNRQQLELVETYFKALNNNDCQTVKGIVEITPYIQKMSNEDWEETVTSIKHHLTKNLSMDVLNTKVLNIFYAGTINEGRIILSRDNIQEVTLLIIKIDNQWKLKN